MFRPTHKCPNPVVLMAIVSMIILSPLQAQITSPDADGVDSLDYPVSGGKVVLYSFHQKYGIVKDGSLTATLPGAAASYNFEWQKFNPVSMSFDPPFQTDNNVVSSSVDGLENGGYRVRVSDGGGTDTLMGAWVWKDHLKARVNTDVLGNLPTVQRTCDYLYLLAEVENDTVVYYDPLHPDALKLPVEYSFLWTSDNPDLIIPQPGTILSPNITYSPPYEDTWYILTVTDSLGMTDVDSVFYESIQTKAEFTVTYWDKYRKDWYPDLGKTYEAKPPGEEIGSLDATLTVRFLNHSRNGDEFHWVFVDTLGGVKETAVTYDTTETPEYTYINAAKFYYPSLLSISESGCEDSITMSEGIEVVESQLMIPNVFSPDGSKPENRLWRFKHQSLKTCKITVVDRSGKVVYKKDITDIYEWDGWDGNIKDSNRPAPAGQYYYIVDALGYDGVEHNNPSVWSQMKIFGGDGRVDTQTPGTGTGDGETNTLRLYTGWVYLYRN